MAAVLSSPAPTAWAITCCSITSTANARQVADQGDEMTRAMRFGIQTGPQHVTWPEVLNIWQVADGLKFDTAWTFDHCFPIMTDPKGSQLEGWITLTALAQATSHVRLGTLVTAITYRAPAVLAKIGATLAGTPGGR